MKRFACPHCGNEVYFDNTACVNCGRRLGYLPERFEMRALQSTGGVATVLNEDGRSYALCDNARHDACNWLVAGDEGLALCVACRHNRTIPDLSVPANLANWRQLELAKRRLFYSLMRWRLPMPTSAEDPQKGLAFDFLADVTKGDGGIERVMTGHDTGLITINIAEADDAERESRRMSMAEPYRTLLGHFRHEVGHYYWDRLVADRGNTERFRQAFGDETQDYGDALRRHYDSGPPADWRDAFISSYAAAHPWEDFAETWAHYIHMTDTLETARAFGIVLHRPNTPAAASDGLDAYEAPGAAELVNAWIPLTLAINSVNRSMGQPDLYPFVLSPPVVDKLQFIHDLVCPNAA